MESNRSHKLWWQSSYDRGLDIALYMWPDIKAAYPDAELHICYGWDLFDKVSSNNPERMKWKESVVSLMSQPGIFHHGRIGQDKLRELRKQCGILFYPTYFPEINMIGALESQRDGLVPVTVNDFALKETVGAGIKIDGDIKDPTVQQTYLRELLALMGDPHRWQEESAKAEQFAASFGWENIAQGWVKEFELPLTQPKVSVITITIRTGFWNIMANNLSKQTYKNFEWVIVDDYKDDRSEIARKYAKEYGLDIKYLRGDKVLKKYNRRYGLVRANNIGWKQSSGELLVFLQDFILIPDNGIESLVDLYRHNDDALLAPVDQYWHCKTPNRENKEDWWDGDTSVITGFSWRNVRVDYRGIRETDNPFDFEMNYAAIPRKILDRLNGWWEFFDDGLGFDNTEIADRALRLGYRILIDDTNEAVCINLWPHIGGTAENIENRERHLSVPYWEWLQRQLDLGLSPIRDTTIDSKLKFDFKVPQEISDKECSKWIEENAKEIAGGWNDLDIVSDKKKAK